MATLPTLCPHCGTAKAGFYSVGSYGVPTKPNNFCTFFVCPACHGPISALVISHGRSNPNDFNGNLRENSNFIVGPLFPEPKEITAPESVPARISELFIQAASNRRNPKMLDAAAMTYRKTLEVGLKELDPNLTGQLYQRIEKLAEKGALTPAMKDWAHEIRLLGNEAAHSESPTEKDVSALHSFTELFLMYAFSLPKMVEASRASKNGT